MNRANHETKIRNWRSIKLFISVLILGLSGHSQAKNNAIIVIGNARFTVITPLCIRIEYANNGNFVNGKTLFAENRQVFFDDFKLVKDNDEVQIGTSHIMLTYKPDGKPFSRENLKAMIKKGNTISEWHPGKKNM